MNIETVNELITSLESAGELSIKERKYLELAKGYQQLAAERDAALNAERVWEKTMMEVCGEDGPASVAREIRALQALRDTAMQALKSQVEQLAAENSGLKRFPEQIVKFIGGLGTSEIGSDTKEKIELAATRIKTIANVSPDFDTWFNGPDAGLRVVNYHIQETFRKRRGTPAAPPCSRLATLRQFRMAQKRLYQKLWRQFISLTARTIYPLCFQS